MRARVIPAIAVLLAACGTATPSGTATPPDGQTSVPTLEPTLAPAATPAATGAFANQPFSMDLPAAWETFDLGDQSGQAALDAFAEANPEMAPAIAAFRSLPNAVFANNATAGNVLVAFALPSAGLSLDLLAANFTAQFAAVPGLVSDPEATNVDLPAGPAVHWDLVLEATDAAGKKLKVRESLYLLADATSAVLVEFVALSGTEIPDEAAIIDSFRFLP